MFSGCASSLWISISSISQVLLLSDFVLFLSVKEGNNAVVATFPIFRGIMRTSHKHPYNSVLNGIFY